MHELQPTDNVNRVNFFYLGFKSVAFGIVDPKFIFTDEEWFHLSRVSTM